MNKAVAELVGFNPDVTSRLARFEPDPVFTSRFNSIILSIDSSKLTNGGGLLNKDYVNSSKPKPQRRFKVITPDDVPKEEPISTKEVGVNGDE
jgi:hypothetical protein